MRLILETNINWYYKNLLISNKVAVIILDKYNNASFRDIVLAERYIPNKQPQYCCINLMHAAYMLLYYVLLFPRGNTGWH